MKPSVTVRTVVILLACCRALAAQTKTYAIKGARLFDGVSGTLTEPGLIVVSEAQSVLFVMKDGVIYRNDRSAASPPR